ncbi:MAG TPA: TIM barrel protein, partial [Rhodothermales bacterium]|nr:TIM barrel protein [Rhodothermales bacterium]
MNRRNFVRTSVVAGGAALTGLPETLACSMTPPASFTLRYAPHFGMFKNQAGDDLVAQLEYAAEQGFRAWEDNNMRTRPVEEQDRIAQAMTRLGMQMGVFVAHSIPWGEPKLTGGNADHRAAFLQEIEESVEVAQRVNATWMTVVPGHLDLRQDRGYQTANLVESLRRAADVLEPH